MVLVDEVDSNAKYKGTEEDIADKPEKMNKRDKGAAEKSIEALSMEVATLKEQLAHAEKDIEVKSAELKKANELKRVAQFGQSGAEEKLKRLQEGSPLPDYTTVVAPIEADLKLAQKEVARQQEDLKALDRLMKAKEAALIEAERQVDAANKKAAMLDHAMNKISELTRHIESQQEENKTLDRMYKTKVEEVTKMTSQIEALEEAVAEASKHVSTIKDLERQNQDMKKQLKSSQDELARAKVAATRVAFAVANEWKDDNDKVIPMKQWLAERHFMLGEADKLKEKLALAEKAVRYETQMKERLQLRLKVIEDGLKGGGLRTPTKKPGTPLSSSRANRAFSSGTPRSMASSAHSDDTHSESESPRVFAEDQVPGALYDMLQKEVITLRKSSTDKEQALKDKEDSVEMLSKKVEMLSKALDVESKKAKREKAQLEKELATLRSSPMVRASSSRRSSGIGTPMSMK